MCLMFVEKYFIRTGCSRVFILYSRIFVDKNQNRYLRLGNPVVMKKAITDERNVLPQPQTQKYTENHMKGFVEY